MSKRKSETTARKKRNINKSEKAYQKLQCSDSLDVFTQEDLPNIKDDIVILNKNPPYHCVELDSFYKYWKSKANDGAKVTNPFTNEEINNTILNKIWRKIKKKYPNDSKPKILNVEILHTFDDEGNQQEFRVGEGNVINQDEIANLLRSLNRDELLAMINYEEDEDSDSEADDEMFESQRLVILEAQRQARELLRNMGGKKRKSKKKSKKIRKLRKHSGINQQTGRLKKGYKYSGKKLKSGLRQIVSI